MKQLIDDIMADLQAEGFTKRDWVLAAIGSIAFVLLTGIAGALDNHRAQVLEAVCPEQAGAACGLH